MSNIASHINEICLGLPSLRHVTPLATCSGVLWCIVPIIINSIYSIEEKISMQARRWRTTIKAIVQYQSSKLIYREPPLPSSPACGELIGLEQTENSTALFIQTQRQRFSGTETATAGIARSQVAGRLNCFFATVATAQPKAFAALVVLTGIRKDYQVSITPSYSIISHCYMNLLRMIIANKAYKSKREINGNNVQEPILRGRYGGVPSVLSHAFCEKTSSVKIGMFTLVLGYYT